MSDSIGDPQIECSDGLVEALRLVPVGVGHSVFVPLVVACSNETLPLGRHGGVEGDLGEVGQGVGPLLDETLRGFIIHGMLLVVHSLLLGEAVGGLAHA